MKFDFGPAMLNAVKATAKNPNFQSAAVGFLRGFARVGLQKAGVPEDFRDMLKQLGDGAESIVGAMVKNDPKAAAAVAPDIIPDRERPDIGG